MFFALLEARIAERTQQFADATAPGRGDGAREAARLWAEIMRRDLDWQLLVIEFRVHAARHADLAARYAAIHDRSLAGLATNIAAAYGPDVDPARVDALARAGFAAAAGAALARGDVVIHPIAVRSVMVKTPAVQEYQVRQTPRGIAVSVVARAGLDARKLESLLRNALSSTGLEQPEVDVTSVDPVALVRHPETGKTRRFIPLPT